MKLLLLFTLLFISCTGHPEEVPPPKFAVGDTVKINYSGVNFFYKHNCGDYATIRNRYYSYAWIYVIRILNCKDGVMTTIIKVYEDDLYEVTK